MNKEAFIGLDEGEKSRLSAAIWNFSSAFTSSQEYKKFKATYSFMNQDSAAQMELKAFKQKQQAINQTFRQDGDRENALAELKKLQNSLLKNPAIANYTSAQEALMNICTDAGGMLSKNIGLDYAAVCAPSCCG
jgi:cell fate (sporulation/competence/biofilm development) regulator YlbF (YheA/YmcA/DUF963 family)